jgi:hypothetical protein
MLIDMKAQCKVENCNRFGKVVKGLCNPHYQRMHKYGDPEHPISHNHEIHRLTQTPEYTSWTRMKARCDYPGNNRYHRYGARGIKVCERWRNSFLAFYNDLGPKPGANFSLSRIDNDGDYEPRNVEWADKYTQGNNRCDNRVLNLDGREHTVTEWARMTGISPSTIFQRLQYGWTVRHALTIPVRDSRRLHRKALQQKA